MNEIAAVILAVDRPEATRRCLDSVLAQQGVDLGVLLWDNGSAEGLAAALRPLYPSVTVHAHPTNLGVAGGRNAAARLAMRSFEPRFLLFLDNDLELREGFARALRGPFDQDDELAQTQAKLLFSHDRERLNDGGGCRIQFWLGRTTPVGFGEIDRGQHDRPTPCVAGGGAMMVRADVFERLGGFDELFGPFGPEDLDFSLRARQAGHHALYVPAAVAYHTPSHTPAPGYSPATRVRHWREFSRRHAGVLQRWGFSLVGAPLMYLRTLVALQRRKRSSSRHDRR